MYQHRYHAKTSPYHVYRWWRTLNYEPSVVLLEREPLDLDIAERSWISMLLSKGARLTNMTDGGEGTSGHIVSQEQRDAISAVHRGKKIDPAQSVAFIARARGPRNIEWREKIGAAHRGKTVSSEVVAKISATKRSRPLTDKQLAQWSTAQVSGRVASAVARKGKPGTRHTEEQRVYMRQCMEGRTFSAETREKMRLAAQIRVANSARDACGRFIDASSLDKTFSNDVR